MTDKLKQLEDDIDKELDLSPTINKKHWRVFAKKRVLSLMKKHNMLEGYIDGCENNNKR